MLSRRQLLQSAAASLTPGVRRELFIASPGKGTAVMASAFYTAQRGGGMMSM
ncbi:MAG: hypothetical protein HZB13_19895, partial [Acidobacteria bacterium]|nr:hypothetical protein [Acidobacteriota bacterium]